MEKRQAATPAPVKRPLDDIRALAAKLSRQLGLSPFLTYLPIDHSVKRDLYAEMRRVRTLERARIARRPWDLGPF